MRGREKAREHEKGVRMRKKEEKRSKNKRKGKGLEVRGGRDVFVREEKNALISSVKVRELG